jgi:ketopantoate hydroxymethyltransferase
LSVSFGPIKKMSEKEKEEKTIEEKKEEFEKKLEEGDEKYIIKNDFEFYKKNTNKIKCIKNAVRLLKKGKNKRLKLDPKIIFLLNEMEKIGIKF